MYQAYILDLDGTLADIFGSTAYFGNSALVGCDYPAIDHEKYRYLAGKGSDLLMHGILQEVSPKGYTEDDMILLYKIHENLYEQDSMYFVDQYDGMEEVLRDLKNRGIRLGVLSNRPHNITTRLITMMYSSWLFNVCYGQHFNAECKPSLDGVLEIVKEFDVGLKNCLYTGDSDIDMQTGTAVGIDTADVLWGFRCRNELEKSWANYIVHEPKEILSIVLGEAAAG